MENFSKYIPREYLALEINYCRKRLEELPKVKLHHYKINGEFRIKVVVDEHKYDVESPLGKEFYKIWQERDELKRQLQIGEAVWHSYFLGEPPSDCAPHEIKRYLRVSYDKRVPMDKAFFDSLNNDDNSRYFKYKNNYFNGIYYRSSAERDIAIYYTENDIPFKYEPSLIIYGLTKTINPDFVLYIKELNTCKIHEHLGMKESSDYLRDSKVKYNNYLNAGLIPDYDVIFTHDSEDVPFDIRVLAAKLNSAIYGTIASGDQLF
ncbi:MAG: hypothetical protein IKG30_12205 [Clostridiales bacterium]|nr:hypothetical protein [Clostridiales bacterium]